MTSERTRRSRDGDGEGRGSEAPGGLDVGQNLAFSQGEWRAQLVGTLLLALVVIAALFGLFGVGPLSDASAERGGLRVDYPRFVRYRAPAVITVHVPAAAVDGTQLEIWFDRAFIQETRVEQVSPEPKDVSVGPERVTYSFDLAEQAAPAVIVLWLQPERIGSLGGALGVVGGATVEFSQFVYP